MKAVLLTSEESFMNNYGASLQGYALFKTLKDLGFDTQIVRYEGISPFGCSAKAELYRMLKKAKSLLKITNNNHSDELMNKFSDEIKARESYFKKFQDENMSFWNEKRVVWKQLKRHYPDADVYVCGSDQIWNPYHRGGNNDPGYFLTFVPQGKIKVAYVPSFSCGDIPAQAQADLPYYIKSFNSVSVREPEGAQIIEKYCNIKVPVLVDPVFLLTAKEWLDMAKDVKKRTEKYILCYRFDQNDFMKNSIDRLSKETGLPVVTVPLSHVSMTDGYTMDFQAGPREFVSLINNAELVCTDSFHATAFSLILHKPLYTFPRAGFSGSGQSMNSRVTNILSIAEMNERLIFKGNDIDYSKIFDVDFSTYDNNISKKRSESLAWLKKSLEV